MSLALSPDWLAHRYDPGHDAVHLIEAPRATRRAAAFLTDEHLPGHTAPVIVKRAEAVARAGAGGRLNFIFHSAYCCSTLLANAYDRERLAFSMKEPVLLNDLVGWRHQGADPARLEAVLRDGLMLLARPFVAGEVGVVKPSNVVNALAPAMVAARPEAGVLLLHAPLEVYLGSIAGKGLFGRLWVRELLANLLTDGIVDLGFAAKDYFGQTDLQVAAVGWLTQHALFARMAQAWPGRVRTLDSETLLARAPEAIAALDRLFGVAGDEAARAAILASVFTRHAKSGGDFTAQDRAADQTSAAALHADEIGKVVVWAEAVAKGAGVTMQLPGALI